MDPVEAPRCVNQVHVRGPRGEIEETAVCSCAAGLIHMHDCPVTAGLPCSHFRELDGAPDAVDMRAAEEVRERLMLDFLSRAYHHRIRSLAPAGAAWQRRREELYAYYATVDLDDEGGPADEREDERYEEEKERLIAQRKKREEAQAAREEQTREEKARERARLGIKTVVEKAREAVADRGNVASSFLDDRESPDPKGGSKKKRPRRRRKKSADPAAGEQPPARQGDAPPERKRRRKRRRRGGGGKSGGTGDGDAPA